MARPSARTRSCSPTFRRATPPSASRRGCCLRAPPHNDAYSERRLLVAARRLPPAADGRIERLGPEATRPTERVARELAEDDPATYVVQVHPYEVRLGRECLAHPDHLVERRGRGWWLLRARREEVDIEPGPVGLEEVLTMGLEPIRVDLDQSADAVEHEQLVVSRHTAGVVDEQLFDDDPTRHVDVRPFLPRTTAVEPAEPGRTELAQLLPVGVRR